jgi:hypothetical protein
MKDLTDLELEYVQARVDHSITAKNCWKLRAALDRAGLTPARENELNEEFAKHIRCMVES